MQIRTRDGGYITLDMEEIRRAVRRQAIEERQRLMEETGHDWDEVEHALFLHDGDAEKARDYLMPARCRDLFPLGQVLITPGAEDALTEAAVAAHTLVARHAAGDWGEEIDEHDRAANEAALTSGARLSAYRVSGEDAPVKVWIITEADRSATIILLPDEYLRGVER